MNYYPFHMGDYAKDTRHLTWDEDLAYRRCLDAYYATEKPLPEDKRALYRLVMAATEAQREAVDTVVHEFFRMTPEGWRHFRCDAEIAKAAEKGVSASKAAKARWEKERADEKLKRTQCGRNADASESDANASKSDATQDPLPMTHDPVPIIGGDSPKPPAPKRRGTQYPADFYPDDTGLAKASAAGISVPTELERFRDHHLAKGSTMKDWQAAWRTWVGNAVRFGRSGQGSTPAFRTRDDERREAFEQLTGRKATTGPAAGPPQLPQGQGALIEGECRHG